MSPLTKFWLRPHRVERSSLIRIILVASQSWILISCEDLQFEPRASPRQSRQFEAISLAFDDLAGRWSRFGVLRCFANMILWTTGLSPMGSGYLQQLWTPTLKVGSQRVPTGRDRSWTTCQVLACKDASSLIWSPTHGWRKRRWVVQRLSNLLLRAIVSSKYVKRDPKLHFALGLGSSHKSSTTESWSSRWVLAGAGSSCDTRSTIVVWYFNLLVVNGPETWFIVDSWRFMQ